MKCDDCEYLAMRVRNLEGLQHPTWWVPARALFFIIVLPITGAMIRNTMDIQIQVAAQNPTWSINQIRAETDRRQFGDWENFSIFTYRPFGGKNK